jgi:D-glycero-beta-D-manno-heptose-7-phosphate kinase
MVKLANILSQLNQAKILVIGDMLLDTYTIGCVRRISPEAPVAVVHVQREEHRPGGAGNVILNLLSLGAQVVAIGRIGPDKSGYLLKEILKQEGVHVDSLFVQDDYQTPVKNRVIADNQQVVRVDHEQSIPLTEDLEKTILEMLPQLFEGVKAIAISDYGKGLLTPKLLKGLIEYANQAKISVVTDPKGHDFSQYCGTTVIKPNLTEAYLAAKLPHHFSLNHVADQLLTITQAQWVMITRSEAGISLFDKNRVQYNFPVTVKEVKDVTGAGDTVLAILTYAVANQLSYPEAAELCNVAASIAIEQVGCARVTLSDLAYRLLEQQSCYKVFDQEHLFVLQEVLKRHSYTLLILSGVEKLTRSLLQALKQLANQKISLVVYINDSTANEVLLELLTSLNEVNFILTHVDSLDYLCQTVSPLETYCFDSIENKLKLMNLLAYLPQAPLVTEVSVI